MARIQSVVVVAKRGAITNVEKYHKHNDIIRQIVPEVAEEITIKIKAFENKSKDLMKKFTDYKPGKNLEEINTTLNETSQLEQELLNTISLVRKTIKSTIEKIKKSD